MTVTNNNEIKQFSKRLLEKRQTPFCNLSLRSGAHNYVEELLEFLFPHFAEKIYYSEIEVEAKLVLLKRNLVTILKAIKIDMPFEPKDIAEAFILKIPDVHDNLWNDAESIFKGDPAAESIDEVILAYPGFLAITIFRISNILYNLNVPILPRIFSEYAHQITGIDIHPGAQIGESFFIDHGTGIVIGETTLIGNNVKIYQGVTLGALSVDKNLHNTKRHPTIEDNVVIYAQAVILGGKTTIGKNSIIGGNVWLTESVPPNSIVYHKSEVKVKNTIKNEDDFFDFVI
ncbi:MAG: serine acetyltransferase [Melioribacteraceae bacterium]|nr:serine acetyltransferase [Melioribacteraceae bacterium]